MLGGFRVTPLRHALVWLASENSPLLWLLPEASLVPLMLLWLLVHRVLLWRLCVRVGVQVSSVLPPRAPLSLRVFLIPSATITTTNCLHFGHGPLGPLCLLKRLKCCVVVIGDSEDLHTRLRLAGAPPSATRFGPMTIAVCSSRCCLGTWFST